MKELRKELIIVLDTTSFAIRPDRFSRIQGETFYDIGKLLSFEELEKGFLARCEGGDVYLSFYREDILRVEMVPRGKKKSGISRAVILEPKKVKVSFEDKEQELFLSTTRLFVKLSKSPLRISIYDGEGTLLVKEKEIGMGYTADGKVLCYKEMEKKDHFYGFGEKTGFLDKRGELYTMWNTDVYAPHNPETDALYQSIPFFITHREGRSYGIFLDNPSKTTFNMKEEGHYSFEADRGTLNYYVFSGPHMKDVIGQYTELTGRIPLPPKWAIGYHQSRYSYETEEEVLELVKNFKEKGIPIDVVYLDIHYMDGYRVFTFDRTRFPNPEKLIKGLKDLGVRVVTIVDPGVKVDPEYQVYQEGIKNKYFCTYLEGNIFFGDVWPGKSAFPDFTEEKVRKWWKDLHHFYTNLGIEGIWNDMNEPAVFNETKTMDLEVVHANDGDPKTHRELHNIYGLMMSKSTYEGMKNQLSGKRPFVLTRAGYSGIQRYAAVWTGDNRSFWEHLQLTVPMIMNLGLSGVPFAGSDIGGFAHDTNAELFTRWIELGAFIPYFRNHSAIGTRRQEPWSFGQKYEDIIKRYIQLRYKWLPQWYSLFEEASRTGIPMMRPLLLEYPEDPQTYNLYDQFMIGDNVIIAPVMEPSKHRRIVYLPEGRWVNYWTDEVFEGKRHHMIEAPLEILPIFVKEGTALVLGEEKSHTGEKDERLNLHLYCGKETTYSFSIYDDDGETFNYENGEYIRLKIDMVDKKGEIHLQSSVEGNFKPSWDKLNIILHHGDGKHLFWNEEEIHPSHAGGLEVSLSL